MRDEPARQQSMGLPAITASFALLAGPADAQQRPSPGPIEEIIVTAQRIEQNVEDVPMSVVAFTGDELERRGVQRIADLNTQIPNLQVVGDPNRGPDGGEITVRGIPNVRNYIDGVWLPGSFGLIAREIIDVERIEVLRGPQGTLFGKDATGGAIHTITRLPGDEFGGRIAATFGEYGRKDVTASLDLPAGDKVRTKWTLGSQNRDGYVRSLATGRDFGDIDNSVVRGDVLWRPTDRLQIRFNSERNRYRQNGPPRVVANIYELPQPNFPLAQIYTFFGMPFTNATHTAGTAGGEVDIYQSKSAYTHDGFSLDQDRSILTVDWDASERIIFKSITAYVDIRDDGSVDACACEYNPPAFLRTLFDGDQFSQEFQLNGEFGRLTWVAGALYTEGKGRGRNSVWLFNEFKQDPNLMALWNATVPFPIPLHQDGGSFLEARSLGVFGQVTVGITDKLYLTAGLRRFREEQESGSIQFDYPINDANVGSLSDGPALAGNVPVLQPESFHHTTPRASLEYVWNDRLMTYVSYAEGFNSGGISRIGPGLPEFPYEPETIETIELGLRSEWLDGMLRFHATAFQTDWNDIQVSTLVPNPSGTGFLPVTVRSNAGAAKADGYELELIVAPTKHWRIDVAVGLLDTRYTEAGDAIDFAVGTPFGDAPELSYSVGFQNMLEFGSRGRLVSRLSYGWIDDHFTSVQVSLQAPQRDYGLLNGYFAYEFAESRYRLTLSGTNLTDEYYFNSRVNDVMAGYDPATVGRPREIALGFQLMLR